MVACTCDPSTWEAEIEGQEFKVHGQEPRGWNREWTVVA